MTNDQFTCYTCGNPGHVASSCPDSRQWVDCAECNRPGHPNRNDITDGIWFCLDCRDPAWRTRLPAHDPRHRSPGEPLYRQPAPQEDRPPPPLINEPGDLRHMNIDQCAKELAQLRQPMYPRQPSSPERDAALRELALRQVGAARKRNA
jgi:Zinc knuckle